jgi:hypothetical protein
MLGGCRHLWAMRLLPLAAAGAWPLDAAGTRSNIVLVELGSSRP